MSIPMLLGGVEHDAAKGRLSNIHIVLLCTEDVDLEFFKDPANGIKLPASCVELHSVYNDNVDSGVMQGFLTDGIPPCYIGLHVQ